MSPEINASVCETHQKSKRVAKHSWTVKERDYATKCCCNLFNRKHPLNQIRKTKLSTCITDDCV